MLNHRTAIGIYVTLQSAFIFVHFFVYPSFLLAISPTLAFFAIEVYGAASISSAFHFRSVCRVQTSQKIVALTFDDGPHPDLTPPILDILREHSAGASFFLVGKNISGNEDLVARIHREGHDIGNHSFSHSFFYDLKGTNELADDISKAQQALEKNTDASARFFRPPYGVSTPSLGRVIKQLGLISIGWNIRSLDTTGRSPEKVLRRIIRRIQPGSIILLHDTVSGNDILLKKLLLFLEENEYKAVTLTRLLQEAHA
jgi:peptidoglycan-N-acetylglucosamine deacetylase